MKIKNITLTHFRSHAETVLKNLGKLVIVLGPNGSGKSGLVDAIAYGVTGSCRGTDEAGRGYESLVTPSLGGKPAAAVVTLDTDKGFINRMVGTGPKSAAQEKVTMTLGLERSALKCAMRSQVFLDLEAKEQEALLRALVASEVSEAQAQAALGVTVPGIRPFMLTSMDGVVGAYKIAFDLRAALKKQAFGQIAAPMDAEYNGQKFSGADDETLARFEAEMVQAEADRATIERAENRRAALRGQISAQEAELVELRARIKPYAPLPEMVAKAGALEKEVEAQEKERAERFQRSRDMANKAAGHDSQAAALKKSVADIMSMAERGAKCGTCHQFIDKTQVSIVTEALTKQIRENEKAAEAAREAAKRLDDGGLLAVPAAQALAQVRKDIDAVKTIREHGKGIKDRQAKAQAELDALGPTPKVDFADMPLHNVREHIAYRKMRAHDIKARAEHEATLEAVEAAVKALGPGGAVRALHMGQGFPELLKEVSAISEVLGVGTVHVESSPKWLVSVNGRPAELLSASERFRASLAFSVVIAKRTGVNMLCLDGADILDDENRAALVPLVEGLGLDQVIVTATNTQSTGDSWDGWTTLRIYNDGGVTRIRQAQEVA